MRILKTEIFKKWVLKLKDSTARYAIKNRLDRIEKKDNLGDYKHIEDDVFELKFQYNGIRIYFMFGANKELVLLLLGGNKTSQQRDIKKAKKLAKEIRNGQEFQNRQSESE